MKRIVVIGGGMAGTSAAHALVKRGYTVTILEKNEYVGGRIRTYVVDGNAVEMGAGFMTRMYSNLLAFLQQEGMNTQLYRQHGSSGVLRDGLVRMATLRTLLGHEALSWRAKIRIAPLFCTTLARWPHLDPHRFWQADVYDNRSVADMFDGSNKELLEYLLQPMLNGYFYWAPEHVSEAMLYILCKAALLQGGTYKMQDGLQQIPERAAKGSTVLLGHTVQNVHQCKDGTYDVTVESKEKSKTLQADGVVCATTASAVPSIFSELSESRKAFFQAVDYSSTAVVARFFTQDQIRGDKGIAFPRSEGTPLAAITAEPGRGRLATVKAFASGTIGRQLCSKPDHIITRQLTKAMEPAHRAVLVGNPDPLATHIQRWPEALPYFDVGHFKRLRSFEKGEIEDPNNNIVFAGDYLGGPFMEGAFTSGMHAAARLDALLTRNAA